MVSEWPYIAPSVGGGKGDLFGTFSVYYSARGPFKHGSVELAKKNH